MLDIPLQSMSSSRRIVFDDASWRVGPDGSMYRRGSLTLSNGDVYEGEFLKGKRSGKGRLRCKCGDSYVGEWQEDAFHGFGVLMLADFSVDGVKHVGSR